MAGTILRDKMSADVESDYRRVLSSSVKAGHAVLAQGGTSDDAVIKAILVLEDSLFNAGHGAVFTHEGTVELDASRLCAGDDLNAGAVTGVKEGSQSCSPSR